MHNTAFCMWCSGGKAIVSREPWAVSMSSGNLSKDLINTSHHQHEIYTVYRTRTNDPHVLMTRDFKTDWGRMRWYLVQGETFLPSIHYKFYGYLTKTQDFVNGRFFSFIYPSETPDVDHSDADDKNHLYILSLVYSSVSFGLPLPLVPPRARVRVRFCFRTCTCSIWLIQCRVHDTLMIQVLARLLAPCLVTPIGSCLRVLLSAHRLQLFYFLPIDNYSIVAYIGTHGIRVFLNLGIDFQACSFPVRFQVHIPPS